MELAKQPETELEYWEAIEWIGGYIWSTMHAINRGHLEDADGAIAKDVASARDIQQKLVDEIIEKFGVIHPKDCPKPKSGSGVIPAPEGKIYYWDWYHKLEREYSLIEYQKLPCSACPFSQGFEPFISSHKVSCTFYPDDNNEFKSHHIRRCGAVTFSLSYYGEQLSIEDVCQRILQDHGPEALEAFKNKQSEIFK